MTTFTPASFARACGQMAHLEETITRAALGPVAEAAKPIMAAASASSGGVRAPASQFKVKKPKGSSGQANAAVVGFGFAVLDEYGSYKHPSGYPIQPKKSGKRQINAKRASYETRARAASRAFGYSKSVLSDGHGFVAAYVEKHPPIKAHPFQGGAEIAISKLMEQAYNAATIAAIARSFG